ncbi:MAG: C-terminal helicase domain-containing protein, partial [Betaproteobacteria bacterium]|nr:C-terminal helicase domain-containing protein [Betaproteobacteria bacterium]
DNIEQRLHYVDDGSHKHRLLDHLLRDADLTQAIVFTATKRGADRLSEALNDKGHATAALHGNMNQSQRNRTLARMRSGDVRVLVATDVAARGIDVASVTHVINYDLPRVAEDYVHRIGRTGRAGATGIAISFAARAMAHLRASASVSASSADLALPAAIRAGAAANRLAGTAGAHRAMVVALAEAAAVDGGNIHPHPTLPPSRGKEFLWNFAARYD